MSREDPITYEELPAEHKQKYDEIKALFEADLIGSFERTHHHGVRWKGFSPEGTLDDMDLSTPSEDRQSSAPGGEIHGSSLTASALREAGERF
jgi:hypothetical protein